MSTATQSSPPDSARYVDYDEFIDFQVQKTRTGIKSNDLLTALIGAAVAVLAYVLVFAAFDHWVIEGGFGRTTRIVLLAVLLAGLCGWLVWKLAIPYFRRVSALYAAREIEETEPGFHSTLLTLIDLKQAGRPISPEIRAALEKRAGLGLTHMNVEQAVDRRLLMRLSYLLLALVVATCLYTILSPKKLSNSLWRSLLPTSAVAVDTRTRIDRVEPGDVDKLAGSQLEVTAELSGVLPDEVTLLYSTADRRFVDEPITMRETDDGLLQYRGVIAGENGRGILQSLTYRVVAGDAQSETYTVTVSQPPSATVHEVEYEYPRYMSLRDRTQVGGAVDAWEGTWVTIRATANMPVKSALLLFSDTDDITHKAEDLPVTVESGTQLTARWQLRIRSDETYPNFYRIQCRNEAGRTDPDPALYPIKIRPDERPQIQLAQPTSDIERPANAIVPLLFAARDPDFLLRSVILRLEQNGESLPQSPRLYEAPPFRKSVTDTYDLDLGPLALRAGDIVTYWLEARDNMEPFADRSGNRTNTPKLNITILEPASPEEVQQQLEEDRQQVENQLEEAQQQPAGDGQEQPPGDESDSEETQANTPQDNPAEGEQQTDEPSAGDQAEPSGERGQTEDDSQSQPGGSKSQSAGTQQGQPSNSGESQSQDQQNRGQGESSESGEPGEQQAPFDDLLKELMQRERQQNQEGEDADSSAGQQPEDRQQPDEESDEGETPPSADGTESGGDQNQSGESQDAGSDGRQSSSGDSASPSADSRPNNAAGEPSASPTDVTPSSPGETTQPAQPDAGTPNAPQPGAGTEPAPDAENPSVREGPVDQGQPGTGETSGKPQRERPSDSSDPSGGRREQPDDSATADPRSARDGGQPDPQNGKPAPEGTNADPSSNSADPNTPKAGEPSPQQDSRTPSGENGQPQQQPPGSPGGNSQQPGETSGQPGQQSSSSQQSGQPGQPLSDGSQQPSQGSEKSPAGAEQPGGESAPSPPGGQPKGEQPDGNSPQGGGQNSAEGDESSPAGEKSGGEKPQGESGSSEQSGGDQSGQPEAGGRQEPGGQQEAGGQPDPGGQQQSQGQEGGGQQGAGQQGGSQPGGSPSQSGSGASQQGGQPGGGGGSGRGPDSDKASPDGSAGGGSQPAEGAGEGDSPADDDIRRDDPDLESKRKAANLVLKRLQEQLQRGEIDPELKRELDVTDEQLRNFTERLQQRLADTKEDTSPEAQARRRQFEETLRTIDYDSAGTERGGGDGPREATRSFAGPERTAPLRRRDATQEYRRRMSSGRPSN